MFICAHKRRAEKKKKKRACVRSVCARLNRCQSTTSFFFFPISPVVTTSPSQHPNKKNTPLFDSASTSHTSGKLFMALSLFFFFYSGAPSAQMAPRKKKAAQRVETMQMEERTRPGGPRCALSAGERKKKKRTGERPP